VANGDGTIKKFDLDGNLLLTYGGFSDLRGIACGRSYFTDQPPPYERFANNNFIYVIEDVDIHQLYETSPGNIQYIRNHSIAPSFPPWPPPPPWPEQMTSIEVDNVGQIWTTVIDTLNNTSRIDKYTPDLEFLCSFNAGGIFNHLLCFTHAGGKWGCGNVIVLEKWGDASGALYYWIATDIVGFRTGSDTEHESHYASYTLVDPALISVKVYDEDGTLIKTVKDTIPRFFDFSGCEVYWWDGSDDYGQTANSGDYRINVTAYSAYLMGSTGEHTNIVSKDGWVHHIDYTEPLNTPTIISVEAVDTCLSVIWEDNNENELGYIIERKDDTDILWIVIDTTSWDVESYVDYNITGSETYYYRIRAYNYCLQSDYSNIMSKKAHPFPPLNVFAENFYCNRRYRPIKKVSSFSPQIEFPKSWDEHCEPAYPDSIPSDASGIYADYPVNQKPGTFAGMQVWSKSCKWYNHNYVKYETTFVNLNRPMLIHTPPDTEYCTDWNYYFMVRTVDTFGDTSIFSPHCWADATPVCVGSCHVQIGGSNPIMKSEFPTKFCLGQNHPNPFNPQTLIRYGLPHNSEVNLIIYNILGQKVRTLVDENQIAGYKTVIWDGKDEAGDQVSSGIYFCRLRAGNYTEVRKMVMLK
jgi:flagellar hook assembly protein FlgD